ncbi:MAG: gamma carbonic anhydrase family protein [Arenicella sp.]|nr:gamma carbonic anhydrase family protein [Arenicella sp.]
MIFALGDQTPQIAESCFIAPSASLIGSVKLATDASVWFNCVLRGDNDSITIGEGSNIQDGSVLHVDPGCPINIGRNVTVGHKVMLHGCSIGDNSLIGMNAVVLNGARIGKNCLIGANTLITENTEIPDGQLVLGSPGNIVKALNQANIELIKASAEHYVENARRYRERLKLLD